MRDFSFEISIWAFSELLPPVAVAFAFAFGVAFAARRLRLRARLLAEGVHDGSSGFGNRRRWGFLGSRQRRRRGHLLLIWDGDLTVVIIRCGLCGGVLESRLWCDGGFGGSLWLRLRLRRQQGKGETCFPPAEERQSHR